ncbi:hypothetical protein PVK74_22505 [Micromonospora chalcea]|uniref:hypothetical protein n=1 Tax=Micromonospora chalcea TaxID=1874 RepID=UPI002378710B|nr:hypothetical protein [Micromonospora chalcea]WDP98627.1 hypothetical protein PVK74_22505 [Micromonospora chalcea]
MASDDRAAEEPRSSPDASANASDHASASASDQQERVEVHVDIAGPPASGTKFQAAKHGVLASKPYLEIGSMIATIAALVGVTVQSCEIRKQNENLAFQLEQGARHDIFSKVLDLDRTALENPVLFRQIVAPGADPMSRRLFATVQRDPNGAEAEKAVQYAGLILDFYDYVLSAFPYDDYPTLGKPSDDDKDYVAWSNQIRITFQDGSFLCDRLLTYAHTYSITYTGRIFGDGLCPYSSSETSAD